MLINENKINTPTQAQLDSDLTNARIYPAVFSNYPELSLIIFSSVQAKIRSVPNLTSLP